MYILWSKVNICQQLDKFQYTHICVWNKITRVMSSKDDNEYLLLVNWIHASLSKALLLQNDSMQS